MSTPNQITVLLAEDHVVVRQGLCALLKTDGGFRLVGEAHNGREAVDMARLLKPDVILMDIAMPTLNGLQATQHILTANPAARVLILSAHSDDVYVERMIEAGVKGFVEKQTSGEILTKAIREIAAGRNYFSPSIARRLPGAAGKPRDRDGAIRVRARKLTAREFEVLQMVAEGSANKQIALELDISIKTVEKHRQHLMDKLDIHETASLTRYAIAAGIVEGGVRMPGI
jgi:DNA-binding NarL/FixJ family response regulator